MLLSSSTVYHCDFAKVAVMLMDFSVFQNAEEKLEKMERQQQLNTLRRNQNYVQDHELHDNSRN